MTYFNLQERDVDLFILEELLSDSGFAGWFGSRIGLVDFKCQEATHSVSAKANAKWGETDVLAFFSSGEECAAVLIEDKIAADFTEHQAERYHERAAELLKVGQAQRYLTALVAPATYLSAVPSDDPWHHRLSLEELRDWFAGGNTAHARWRSAALAGCLSRVSRSKNARDAEVRRFSEAFAAFLRAQPGGPFDHKITGDKWGFIVATPLTPPHVSLAWKPGKQCVDLTFSSYNLGKAAHVLPPPGVSRRLAEDDGTKSDRFIIQVPMVDLSAPFDDQIDVVADVMAAARQLLSLVPLVLAAPEAADRRAALDTPGRSGP